MPLKKWLILIFNKRQSDITVAIQYWSAGCQGSLNYFAEYILATPLHLFFLPIQNEYLFHQYTHIMARQNRRMFVLNQYPQ